MITLLQGILHARHTARGDDVAIIWITSKTDWKINDYYNYADLNRVEENTDYLKNLLTVVVGITPTITGLTTNRTNTRFEFYDDLNRIEGNILNLKESFYKPIDWETPKTTWFDTEQGFKNADANRLEKNLDAMRELIVDTENGYPRCGSLICGAGSELGYGLGELEILSTNRYNCLTTDALDVKLPHGSTMYMYSVANMRIFGVYKLVNVEGFKEWYLVY